MLLDKKNNPTSSGSTCWSVDRMYINTVHRLFSSNAGSNSNCVQPNNINHLLVHFLVIIIHLFAFG